MKKLIALVFLGLSMLAATPNKVQNPIPQCDPCDWAR
jgi:hypothetical protein